MAVIHAIIHAERLGDNKITADHVNMRPLQRGVVKAHRQTRGDVQLQQTGGLLNQLQRFSVGDAGMFVVDRLVMMCGQIRLDLRASTIHDDQANTQAMQQADVIDNTGEILMLNGFATQHDDKRLSPVGVDIGNRMAESLDQFDSTFLHHGTTPQ